MVKRIAAKRTIDAFAQTDDIKLPPLEPSAEKIKAFKHAQNNCGGARISIMLAMGWIDWKDDKEMTDYCNILNMIYNHLNKLIENMDGIIGVPYLSRKD